MSQKGRGILAVPTAKIPRPFWLTVPSGPPSLLAHRPFWLTVPSGFFLRHISGFLPNFPTSQFGIFYLCHLFSAFIILSTYPAALLNFMKSLFISITAIAIHIITNIAITIPAISFFFPFILSPLIQKSYQILLLILSLFQEVFVLLGVICLSDLIRFFVPQHMHCPLIVLLDFLLHLLYFLQIFVVHKVHQLLVKLVRSDELIPYTVIMSLAIPVATSISLLAPVDISFNAIFSAALPPSKAIIFSSNSVFET